MASFVSEVVLILAFQAGGCIHTRLTLEQRSSHQLKLLGWIAIQLNCHNQSIGDVGIVSQIACFAPFMYIHIYVYVYIHTSISLYHIVTSNPRGKSNAKKQFSWHRLQ